MEQFSLVVRPHVFSDRDCRVDTLPLGKTIAELVTLHTSFDPSLRNHLIALVNGEIEDNFDRIPMAGDTVTLALRVHGGGGNGKSILSLVAVIALTVVSGWAGAAAYGSGFGTAAATAGAFGTSALGASLVSAGVMMVGSLVINAVFAPPKVATTATGAQGANAGNTYSFGSQANQVRQYGRVPKVYGQHKVVFDIAGLPYTLNVGDDTYFYALYCVGYAPLKVEDFKIGQNSLANYSNYDINVIENFTDASQLQIYRNDIWQEAFNSEVSQKVGALSFTTRPATDQAILDLIFSQGLVLIDKKTGGYRTLESSVRIEVRDKLVPGSVFGPLTAVRGRVPTVSRGILGGLYQGGISSAGGDSFNLGSLGQGLSVFDISVWAVDDAGQPVLPTAGSFVKIGGDTFTVKSASLTTLELTTPLPNSIRFGNPGQWEGDYPFTYSSGANAVGGDWVISDNKTGSFPASIDFALPRASTWEIRVTSTTPDRAEDANSSYVWSRAVVSLKSIKSDVPPMKPEVPLTVVELRIKATGQLNGSVEEFNGVATSKLRQWKNGQWVVDVTRNAAWAYLDVLTGAANSRALPDSRVDIEKIRAWALKNDLVSPPFTLPGGTCDVVIDRGYTTWELLQSIASTGRAAPTMRDSKYSVIIDDEARQPVQMFSPRNSSGLQSSRTYLEGPHALRVKWIDPQANYTANTAVVYRTGYTEVNATVFEDLDTFGLTSQEAAIRYGRYTLAQGLLRQERFTVEVDIENIVCTRGDLVLVAHDVITVGGETVRIRYISGSTLEIDAPLDLQFDDYENLNNSPAYGIRVRKSNGYMTGVIPVKKLFGQEITVETGSMLVGVAAGDLVVYGALDSIVGMYTVDQVSSGGDFNATISLEEYAPLVYQAEYTGIIPEYVPQQGASYQRGAPREFNGTIIEYVEDAVYPRCRIHLTWIPPVGTVSPFKYAVSEIRSDKSELFMGETAGLDFTTDQIDMWILGGSTLGYAVRAYFESTGPGSPAFTEVNLPVRATVAPPNFDFFEVVPLPSGLRKYNFSYTRIDPPAHVTGGEIRYYPGRGRAPDWANMVNLAGEYPTMPYPTSGVELSNPPAGDWTFGIRAVDQLGVLAAEPKYFSITLPRSINQGATPDADFTPPPTPTGFKASGFFTRILVEQDAPSYSAGGGHKSSSVYGLVYVDGTPEPTFAQAKLIQEFTGNVAQIAADMGTKYRLWLKWRTRADVESVTPAGPIKVETGQDVAKLIQVLQGQITSSALHRSLAERIDLIDAGDNVPGSVSARIKALEETLVDSEGSLASQIAIVQARINVRPNILPNGGFELDTPNTYFSSVLFSTFADTWGNWIYTNTPGATGSFYFKDIAVFPNADYVFTGDIRKTGNGVVYFRLEYFNAAGSLLSGFNGPNLGNNPHDFSFDPARRQQLAVQGKAPTGSATVRCVVGWSGITANSQIALRYLKLELGQLPATFYTMEGGQSAISASIKTESSVRASQTGDLYAQYTIKQDLNGYISGYGLASTVKNAVPTSAFAVRADTFYIANPTGPGIAPAMPFIVRTVATTINGVPVPVGVYIQEAFIQNGTIVNAKIANATIEDAKILNLSAAKINTGYLSADRIAAGTITATMLTIGNGQNILQDSTWVNRSGRNNSVPSGWDFNTNAPEGQFEVWREDTYPTWFPATARGVVLQKKTAANGSFMYIDGRFLAEAGKRYEGSVFAGAHRCDVYCEIIFIGYGGGEIGRVGGAPNPGQQAGGRVLGDFRRIGVFGFAPVGTAYALFRCVKNDTYVNQGNDSFAFLVCPMVAVANSAQVDFSPYAPSGTGVQITPSGISTPNLSSLNNNLGYIGAGQVTISGETVSGGWGFLRSPNKWLDNTTGWIMANNAAAGETFISFKCGGMTFQMHATPTGSSAVIDFGGFYADSTGAVVLRALDVIDTLNVRSGALASFVTATGLDRATVGVAVPNGQVYQVKFEAFARPTPGTFFNGVGGGYTMTLPGGVSGYAPFAMRGGEEQNTFSVPVPMTLSATVSLGGGYHNLTAQIDSIPSALIVDVSAHVLKR